MPLSDELSMLPGEAAPASSHALGVPAGRAGTSNRPIAFTVAFGGFLEGQPAGSEAFRALANLRKLGIRCFLITGLGKGDLLDPPEIATAFDGYCLEGGAQWGSWDHPLGPANATVVMAAADRAEQAGIKVQRRRASFTCSLDALAAVEAVAGDCVIRPRRDVVNVLPPGLDKGIGLDAVLAPLGLRAAHAICLAATADDLPLFKSADVALASSDADAAAKQAADEVLASSGPDALVEACTRLARGDWHPNSPNSLVP